MTHDRAAFLAWNAANQRARDEYQAHPIAACAAADCFNLTRGRAFCVWHAKLENAA